MCWQSAWFLYILILLINTYFYFLQEKSLIYELHQKSLCFGRLDTKETNNKQVNVWFIIMKLQLVDSQQ